MEIIYIVALLIMLVGCMVGINIDKSIGKYIMVTGMIFGFGWFCFSTLSVGIEQITTEWEKVWTAINY